MEIKIGNTVLNASSNMDALGYWKTTNRIAKMLFGVSGIELKDYQVYALAMNLHRFLIDNPEFVVGIVNAGKINCEEKNKNNA